MSIDDRLDEVSNRLRIEPPSQEDVMRRVKRHRASHVARLAVTTTIVVLGLGAFALVNLPGDDGGEMVELGGPTTELAEPDPAESAWASFPLTTVRIEDRSIEACARLVVGTVDREFCGLARYPMLWKVDDDYYMLTTQGGSVGDRTIPRVENHVVVGKVQPGERAHLFPPLLVPPEWEHIVEDGLGSQCFNAEVADVVATEHPLDGSDAATGYPFSVTGCSPTATTAYLHGIDAQVELRHDGTSWSAVN